MIGLWAIEASGERLARTRTMLKNTIEVLPNRDSAVRIYEHPDAQGGLQQPAFLLIAEDPRRVTKHIPRELDVLCSAAYESTGAPLLPAEHGSCLGLLVGLTDCRSPDQVEEFDHWYEHTHAADVVRSPYYWRARRYRRAGGDLPEYLALYDTEDTGADAFARYLKWPERDATMHEACVVQHVWTFDRVLAQKAER